MLSAALLERWPQVCRVKITFTKLLTNRFVSTTKKSMKCDVNWIPLRIRVRSRNTQPHLTVEGKELELELDLDQFQLQFFTSLVYSQPHPPRPANCTLFCLEVLFLFRSLSSDPRCNQAHGRDNKASKTTSRTMLQRAPNTQHAARSTACCLDSHRPQDDRRLFY